MEEKDTQWEYLHHQIAARLRERERSVRWYQRRHYYYQVGAVVLSALITVISGFKVPCLPDIVASNLVLCLGALSTVIAAFGAFFSPQQSWHLHAEIYGRLRALEAELDFAERRPDFKEREDVLADEKFREYQQIMGDLNERWQTLRQKST